MSRRNRKPPASRSRAPHWLPPGGSAPPGGGPEVVFMQDERVKQLGPDAALVVLQDEHGNTVSTRAIHTESVPGMVAGLMRPGPQGAHRHAPVPLPPADAPPPHYFARDVPRLRDSLLEAWRSGLLHRMLMMHAGNLHFPYHPGTLFPWTVEEYVPWLGDRLAEADLFYVTRDMSQVVRQAAQAAPYYQVAQDQQPARAGFVVFGDSVCTITDANATDGSVRPGERSEIVAALWAWVDDCGGGEPGVHLVTLQDSDVMLATRRAETDEQTLMQARGDWGPLAYHDEFPLPWGTRPYAGAADKHRLGNQPIAAVQSTWIMMTQRITVERQVCAGTRQQRRAAQREGRPEPAVREVTLRRASPAEDRQQQEPGGSGRKYTKRWVVGEYGYWRNTWYPSVQEHRQQFVFVPSYVKGPDGAPLVGGERVNTLRR